MCAIIPSFLKQKIVFFYETSSLLTKLFKHTNKPLGTEIANYKDFLEDYSEN